MYYSPCKYSLFSKSLLIINSVIISFLQNTLSVLPCPPLESVETPIMLEQSIAHLCIEFLWLNICKLLQNTTEGVWRLKLGNYGIAAVMYVWMPESTLLASSIIFNKIFRNLVKLANFILLPFLPLCLVNFVIIIHVLIFPNRSPFWIHFRFFFHFRNSFHGIQYYIFETTPNYFSTLYKEVRIS